MYSFAHPSLLNALFVLIVFSRLLNILIRVCFQHVVIQQKNKLLCTTCLTELPIGPIFPEMSSWPSVWLSFLVCILILHLHAAVHVFTQKRNNLFSVTDE